MGVPSLAVMKFTVLVPLIGEGVEEPVDPAATAFAAVMPAATAATTPPARTSRRVGLTPVNESFMTSPGGVVFGTWPAFARLTVTLGPDALRGEFRGVN